MFNHTPVTYAAIAGIAVAIYAWIVLILRISGKRSLAKLNAFDFVVTVAFGSLLATVIVSDTVDWGAGAVGVAMLAALQFAVTWLSVRSHRFKALVRSEPALLLRDGKLDTALLERERVTRTEIEAAIRGAGLGRFDEVAAVVLETDGSFSVIARRDGPVDLLTDVRTNA